MKESYVSWNEFPNEVPPNGSKVLVRVYQEYACADYEAGARYFEDRLGSLGMWCKAQNGCVTHWISLPSFKCPTCGRL